MRPVQLLRLGPHSNPCLSVMLHRTWQAAARPANQQGPGPAAMKGPAAKFGTIKERGGHARTKTGPNNSCSAQARTTGLNTLNNL